MYTNLMAVDSNIYDGCMGIMTLQLIIITVIMLYGGGITLCTFNREEFFFDRIYSKLYTPLDRETYS